MTMAPITNAARTATRGKRISRRSFIEPSSLRSRR
jgi:hypothetical protein